MLLKITRFLTVAIVAVVFAFSATNTFAQDQTPTNVPNQQMGLGVQLQSPQDIGVVGSYALSPQMHIGVQFGLAYDTGYDVGGITYKGGLNFNFSPFLRYYLNASGNFKPFLMGGANITSTSVHVASSVGGGSVSTSKDYLGINLGGGAHWFPYKSVGVYAGINVIQFDTDNSQMLIGVGSPVLGIDWWF